MNRRFLAVFTFIIIFSLSLNAQVTINEFVPKGSSEWVELYNAGGSAVNLDGWKIYELEYPDTVDLTGRTIPAGGYDTLNVGYLVDNSGDILILVDNTGDTVDMMGVGYMGGAPMAPYDPLYSVARVTDGLDTDDDARDFTIDATPTPEAANDPAGVDLGSSLIINEIRPYPAEYPTVNEDSVELYNPTGSSINVLNWLLCDGDAVAPITLDASVPPYGYMVLERGTHFYNDVDFSGTDVSYLFNSDSIRVDQLGWEGEYNDYSFQRIPDGTGPNDGYNWISSGGGTTLKDTFPTWGGANPTSGIDEEIITSGLNLSVPDISGEMLNVRYSVPEKQMINLSLYDGLGRLIRVIMNKTHESGYFSGDFRIGDISSGIYFMVLSGKSESIGKKITIIK